MRKRVILDIRDLYPEVFFQNGILRRSSFFGKIIKKIEIYMYRKSFSISTVTEGLKNEINNSNRSTIVIRNGFDEKLFCETPEKFDDFTLVFHGNMGKFQNIELLKSVIQYFNENDQSIKFLIIGNEGSQIDLIRNMRSDNLNFMERIPYNEIPSYISKCHVGLSFRTDDYISRTSFPVKVFEYIGVVLPVLVTPLSEAGHIVEEEGFGIETENDLASIINSIYLIKSNYMEYIHNIRAKRHLYTRSNQAEKLLKITEKM
jgi:glycosyltransferase involved in cell wall biosynthesis